MGTEELAAIAWRVGDVYLFSRASRAVVATMQIWVPVEDARGLLRRAAAIDTADRVSWGDITRVELERLVATADPDDAALYREGIDSLAFDLGPCSLSYPGFP